MKMHLIAVSALVLLSAGAAAASTVVVHKAAGASLDVVFLEATSDLTEAPIDGFVPVDVSPVPLPAAGWMLLAGLGGIAAMRRRTKA
jgi:hypothetical protein